MRKWEKALARCTSTHWGLAPAREEQIAEKRVGKAKSGARSGQGLVATLTQLFTLMLGRSTVLLASMSARLRNGSAASASSSMIASSSTSIAADGAAEEATTLRRTKRARYVPPPLQVEKNNGIPESVKQEYEVETIPTAAAHGMQYSLRRQRPSTPTATSQTATYSTTSSPSSRTKGKGKIEVKEEDLDYTPGEAASPRRKPGTPKKDPFSTSPRKTTAKPIKIELEAHESFTPPKRWHEQLQVLNKQRRRILAPVDTMGCQENGKDDRRKDARDDNESPEASARRERFTILVSLMLSSQTKDPVTAEAVYNLQRNLPNGLCLQSILDASQDDISQNINKVGFWRRKTGYIQSAAQILHNDFDGDVPKTIDELCSLPGVGPKMGFLALQGCWRLNVGIGVDVHVHRVANRLKWVKSTDPEGTRLQLQSWLPKDLHPTINKTLVGFGQVVCVPIGPRCDLCALGAARLCPSYRRVDAKSVASRVKVDFLPESQEDHAVDASTIKGVYTGLSNGAVKSEPSDISPAGQRTALAIDGPEGQGIIMVKDEPQDDAPGIVATPPAHTRPRCSKGNDEQPPDAALDW